MGRDGACSVAADGVQRLPFVLSFSVPLLGIEGWFGGQGRHFFLQIVFYIGFLSAGHRFTTVKYLACKQNLDKSTRSSSFLHY